MRRRIIFTAFCALALTGAAPAQPRRIVSLNTCADQYVLALADPAQIAALSPYGHDPELSAAVGKARAFRTLKRPAEEVLALRPDLLIGFPSGGSVVGAPPGRWRTLGLASADSYPMILQQIRQVAAAVGHTERGEALIRAMNRDLAALPRPKRRGVAAYYQRRGYMTGTGTLVDDLMRRVGLVNLAGRLGKPALSQLSLEEMIAARPDWLIVESGSEEVVDQGTEMLRHPILRAIPRIRVPQAWTVCGGPAYVDAARSIAAQLDGAAHKGMAQLDGAVRKGAVRVNAAPRH
ncbi:cobalamin ABC transporter substrate-binding protein [Sphingobium sp. TA15]|uniref:ABC-type transport system periplasmic component n=1 Tax=Sphingobium indicum (strain DSM 16413 / CCM 7287 / MTCC 6362 / UT26 / NBRC 101211 / UT26S) TaxID=452662 RepID=D4Z501_SPHIU|nr:ABC transporter substrate-binding protein [Sphingobium indicum]BAI97683.1 ABC-type transport system periplasmic component [Sphingobium indicum UT26S]BDD67090.1 cobalamin ABC transporter substrate-binding protein [Sphingobium sp. TA15]